MERCQLCQKQDKLLFLSPKNEKLFVCRKCYENESKEVIINLLLSNKWLDAREKLNNVVEKMNLYVAINE